MGWPFGHKIIRYNYFFERKHIIEDVEAVMIEAPENTQILTIWRFLKMQILINQSLKKPRLAMIWELILNKTGKQKPMKRQ